MVGRHRAPRHHPVHRDAATQGEYAVSHPPVAVVILAAGAGTRMRSETPKVLNVVAGRTLLGHAIAAGRHCEPQRLVVVVRHERDRVAAEALKHEDVLIADQDEVPGTGRAVQCALRTLADDGVDLDGPIVVTAADTPLLDGPTLAALLESHLADRNAVTVLTTHLSTPTGYGRVVREKGSVVAIVEEKDASEEQRLITEVNAAVYVFDTAVLREALDSVGRDNAQGEVYLTDVIRIAHERGLKVAGIAVEDSWTVEGANDKVQLAALAKEMNRRIVEDWMRAGVTVIDPATTWIDVDVELAPDVTILPGVQLHGASRVESHATIGPFTTLTDVEVKEGATVIHSHGLLAVVGPGATVGPFANLRPGTLLDAGVRVGAFVETKNATIGADSRVRHLAYVGDATIGTDTNIGAGTVFANFDGVTKQHTQIGDHARIGVNNTFVAPVTVGDGVYTGAGTTVRRDIPSGDLAVNTTSQRNIEGWVLRNRAGSAAADAAAAARTRSATDSERDIAE